MPEVVRMVTVPPTVGSIVYDSLRMLAEDIGARRRVDVKHPRS